ncbi:MAG: hypothetical protein ABGX07_15375 [Pirellulaceae bacterium]
MIRIDISEASRTGRLLSYAICLLIGSAVGVVAEESDGGKSVTKSMLQQWTGPYGGVPPWHLVRPDAFPKAFDEAIRLAKLDIDAITAQSDDATFDNTFLRLEDSARALNRLNALYGVHTSNLNVGPMADVEAVVEPKLADFWRIR